jgi:subfamily B ATP-binding cassette protein HlyB/CyaB
MLARFHSIAVDPHQIAHEFKETGKAFGVTEILLPPKNSA